MYVCYFAAVSVLKTITFWKCLLLLEGYKKLNPIVVVSSVEL